MNSDKMNINKNLTILLSGQLISQVGDKFYLLALSYWVLESTKSTTTMGIVLFFSLFPEIVVSFAAGAFVDKYDRKLIIVGTDFLRGFIVLGLGALFYLNLLTLPLIIIGQIFLSVNTAFFNPVIPAVIPQIVEEDKLTQANSKTQLIRGIALILGPVLGGLSVVRFGYLFVFMLNAGSYLVSGGFEMFMKIPKVKADSKSSTIVEDIAEGYKFIIRDSNLVLMVFTIAIIHFFVGAIQTIMPVFAGKLEGVGVQNLGYLQTSMGIGMTVISLFFGFISIKNKEGKVLFGSLFMVGLVNVLMSLLIYLGINQVFFHSILFSGFGGFLILAVTAYRTILQKKVPNNMSGRVFGLTFTAGDLSLPLAMLVLGFLLDRFDFAHLLAVSGLGLMIVCIWFFKLIPDSQSLTAQQPKNARSA